MVTTHREIDRLSQHSQIYEDLLVNRKNVRITVLAFMITI